MWLDSDRVNMWLWIFTLLAAIDRFWCLEAGAVCKTPNGEKGYCISLYECDAILDAISSRTLDALRFSKQSHCGCDESEPLVCCGTQSNFLPPTESPATPTTPPHAVVDTPDPLEQNLVVTEEFQSGESDEDESSESCDSSCGCKGKEDVFAPRCLDAGDICKTPNGETANCISLYECDVILDAIAMRSMESLNFSKQSHCGCEDSEPLVCCGSHSEFVEMIQTEPPDVESTVTDQTTTTMTTEAPTTRIPTTITGYPTTKEPTTNHPTTKYPTTKDPTTKDPTTKDQTTKEPTTKDPTTKDPMTINPTTKYPTTRPTTMPPVMARPSLPPIQNNSILANRRICGYRGNEDDAKKSSQSDEYPWLGVIFSDTSNRPVCYGSLISRRYVLTSAICLMANPKYPRRITRVRLGEYDISKSGIDCVHDPDFDECSEPPIDYRVEDIIVHENYNKERNYDNDIGLIRLARSVHYTDYTRPICLPDSSTQLATVGDVLHSTGWDYLRKQGQIARTKKMATSKLVDDEECKMSLADSASYYMPPLMICSKYAAKGQCLGDSGVPIMFSNNHQWHLEGIISFAKEEGNCDEDVILSTKVSNYLDWIISKIKS